MLPSDDADLETAYTSQDYLDVDAKDDVRVNQYASGEYAIHQFKDYVGSSSQCTLEWEGQSDIAPSSSIVKLQIYNHNSNLWEDIDTDNSSSADTDFTLTGEILDLTDYKNGDDIISCRIYQNSL